MRREVTVKEEAGGADEPLGGGRKQREYFFSSPFRRQRPRWPVSTFSFVLLQLMHDSFDMRESCVVLHM